MIHGDRRLPINYRFQLTYQSEASAMVASEVHGKCGLVKTPDRQELPCTAHRQHVIKPLMRVDRARTCHRGQIGEGPASGPRR